MERVLLTGWQVGVQKVSLDKLIQRAAKIGLKEAKEKVDQLLLGEEISIVFPTLFEAENFCKEASKLGAMGKLEKHHSDRRDKRIVKV